jgi:hypothetical protein
MSDERTVFKKYFHIFPVESNHSEALHFSEINSLSVTNLDYFPYRNHLSEWGVSEGVKSLGNLKVDQDG